MVRTLILIGAMVSSTAHAGPPDAAKQALPVTFHAEGAQIYECKAREQGGLAWEFREPIATLLQDGKTVGRHYAGPSWALDDGGSIAGKVSAVVKPPTPTDISWLRLAVVAHHGEGLLARVNEVQRINTEGGMASGACGTAGALLSVAYSADYVFLEKSM